jgi:tRNA(Ile)-lysidine synthase
MLDDGDRVLVAVSGGPDSVVLLDVLDRLKEALSLELVVAHFDHRLRPDDDDRETRFVASGSHEKPSLCDPKSLVSFGQKRHVP